MITNVRASRGSRPTVDTIRAVGNRHAGYVTTTGLHHDRIRSDCAMVECDVPVEPIPDLGTGDRDHLPDRIVAAADPVTARTPPTVEPA